MDIPSFSADDLFEWLTSRKNFLLLDVRNDVEFGRFKVEGPFGFEMVNVPYMEFIEHEAESVTRVPGGKPVRIVCAKEGSAKFVAEILRRHGFPDVAYLREGIKAWGNLLAPIRVDGVDDPYALYQVRRPGKASLSYGLVYNGEMMVFDPAKNIAAYRQIAEAQASRITRVFETHRQADYISGSRFLHQSAGAEIMAPEPDFKGARFPYTPVRDGEVYPFKGGGPEVRAVHTPGHTPGSTSYLIDGRFFLSGDTVFIRSIGRPDLGGMAAEWSEQLFHTMTEKIVPLDDSIQVLPGHYMDWAEANEKLIFTASCAEIKSMNSDIYNIKDPAAFYDFIRDNLRPQPEEYAKIREINAGLVEVDEQGQDILDLGKNECAASARPPGRK